MDTNTMRKKIIELARADIGLKEPSGDDKFINWYNKTYRTSFSLNVPWCAMAATYWLRNAGVPEAKMPGYASCTDAINKAKSRGVWRQRGTYTPQVGDVVIFESPETRHTGIVESVSGSVLYTIEGNTGNAVKSKSYSLTSSYILGYIDWDGTEKETKNTYTLIKTIQSGLNSKYNLGLVVDGSFGPLSETAMIKAVQTEINKSYGNKLTIDGSWGPVSKSVCPGITYGMKGNFVWLLQACLNVNGIYLDLDGSFGPATLSGIKQYQKNLGLIVDGSAGPATWTALLSWG